MVDRDFIVLWANKVTEDLLGLSKEDIVGQKCYRIFHRCESPPPNCPLVKYLTTHEEVELELPLPALGDRWFWVSVFPIDGGNTLVHLARDITRHKTTEDMLRKSERRYRELYEKSAAGIFRVTPDGRFLDANPRLQEILGYDLEELKKLDIARDLYVNPEERRYFIEAMEKKGGVNRYRVWLKRKDGTPVCISVYGSTVRDNEGKTLYYHGTVLDITERMKAEEALKKLERRWFLFVERAPLGFFQFDSTGEIITVNGYMAQVLGYTPQDLVGENIYQVLCGDLSHAGDCRERLETSGELAGQEVKVTRGDGTTVWLRFYVHLVEEGGVPLYEGICMDITQERLLQEQLYLSQKMEAMGRLAGGVAHDFNNILMVILGTCDLLLYNLEDHHPARQRVLTVRESAKRAAALTRQLLAFSKRQIMEPQVVDLNQVVSGMEKLFRRLLGEDIRLRVDLSPDLWKIKVDPAHMEQVIMNLVVNARDAMPQGGTLVIETANVELDSSYLRSHMGMEPGQYVLLAVSDTGHGMDEETRSRIFEPFFSTKKDGTGLGLATVYGIVKQSGGNIWCYSEPGKGTTFKVYFPRFHGEEEKAEVLEGKEVSPATGGERVLLVEDDHSVREITRALLEGAGYQVMDAARGKDALETLKQGKCSVDLLITDVVMPGMSGKDLAEKVRSVCPRVKVLYMSGYTGEVMMHHGVSNGGVHLIQKPFSREEFLRKVREILNGR